MDNQKKKKITPAKAFYSITANSSLKLVFPPLFLQGSKPSATSASREPTDIPSNVSPTAVPGHTGRAGESTQGPMCSAQSGQMEQGAGERSVPGKTRCCRLNTWLTGSPDACRKQKLVFQAAELLSS